jgi:hypothetical protein
LFRYCGWYCRGELDGESVFLLLVGVGRAVSRVRVRFGIVLRLPARKTLDMGWREGVWHASDALMWVLLEAVCVGECGSVFWFGILVRFVRGDGGGVVMPLFRV